MLTEIDNAGRFLFILVFTDTNKCHLDDYSIAWDDFKTIVEFLLKEKNDHTKDEDISVRGRHTLLIFPLILFYLTLVQIYIK